MRRVEGSVPLRPFVVGAHISFEDPLSYLIPRGCVRGALLTDGEAEPPGGVMNVNR